jgi:hypothetical protein
MTTIKKKKFGSWNIMERLFYESGIMFYFPKNIRKKPWTLRTPI